MQEDDKEAGNALFGKLASGGILNVAELKPSQHFTQPPAHYTEASLVKAMEEQGIGRPSTYAPTITTILARRYVTKKTRTCMLRSLVRQSTAL